ncbi:hypothetical protein SO694_00041246 [Aureococcus anophagefferens]|uniref:K Homology domain-containing protein n=1 Tax=Aureococcus anophagefferens TaxID=44056 RepID=A0ABR1G6K2_AURAN
MSDDEMSDDERRGRRERSPSPAARSKSPSKSKSPEKSPPRSPGGEPPARVTQTLEVDKDDAAFILGRGGSTKRKIARVSGTEIELDEHTLQITLNGSAEQCARAKDYIDFVRQQRVGPVTINMDTPRDDFSAYIVPGDCIGFVMGRNGQTLRSMEEEWGVLMFFAKTDDAQREGGRDGDESLCIFGPLARPPRRVRRRRARPPRSQAARRGAEVKVMSAVEHKHPGYCVSSKGDLREHERVQGDTDVDGWGCDTYMLTGDNFSYALGAKGSTRRKLAAASGCIIEYVGYKKDRRRGKDYLRWLIEQRASPASARRARARLPRAPPRARRPRRRHGPVRRRPPEDRSDCSIVKVPGSSIAFITGHRGESLRAIERESGTRGAAPDSASADFRASADGFCFTDGERNSGKESENLLVFSFRGP